MQYSITKHKRTSADTELLTKDAFTYSPQDRLLTQTHQINGGTIEVIASNTYDELGQLISKKVGGNTQNINYTYNIRGWLTGINDVAALSKAGDPKDLFAFKINYNNTPAITGGKALYNGNIAETFWSSTSDATPIVRGYAYLYDNLNRLKTSVYKRDAVITNAYSENLTYDKNGNINSIIRNGNSETATQIDALVYTYAGTNTTNQLVKVVDNAPAASKVFGFTDSAANTVDDYSYDFNGNMTKDNNKNITAITYNHLNLPTKITFATTGNIVYIYNAAGQKVQKIVNEIGKSVVTTDYLGGYQYDNGLLKFFPTAEGYVEPSGSSYKYVYQYKDHLGNVRLSYDKTLVIKEESNFYPFGLKQEGYNTVKSGVENKYKFLGQERQDELGLNWDTFRYRNYDYAIGRFMGVDPITEKFYSISPYQFAHNNPVWKIELEGLEGQVTTNQDIVNREPVYMTTNIIINTTNIQSGKPQNSRPGVAMFRMGIGVENSYTKEVGNENGGASATATAYKANVGIAVCIDGESVEYGMTVGQISADGKVGGQTVGEGQFTTFSAEGSYNIKTGEQKSNIDTFTGEVNTLGSESKQTEDLKFSFNALGAYIEANLTEAGNNFKDFANLVTSYLQGATQSYFNQNNTSNTNITPVK